MFFVFWAACHGWPVNVNGSKYGMRERNRTGAGFMTNSSLVLQCAWIDEEDIDATQLVDARKTWSTWRGDQPYPTWATDRFLQIDSSLLPFSVVVIRLDTNVLEYIYWGSSLSRIFGNDHTGGFPGLLKSYDSYDPGSTSYEQTFADGLPRYLATRFSTDSGNSGLQLCVRLPLATMAELAT